MAVHRYWRIRVLAAGGDASVSASEIALHGAIGGVNLAVGGTASASVSWPGYPAGSAFDGNPSTAWMELNNGMPQWIAYDFGAGVSHDIVEVAWSVNALGYKGPTAGVVQFSDDNATWVNYWNIADSSSWSDNQTKVWADNTPVVSSVSPAEALPGATVTIVGSRFTGATDVTIGGTSVPFTVVSDAQIAAVVPPTGYGDVAVTTAGGTTVLPATPMGAYERYESTPTTPGSNPPDGLAPPWLLGPKGVAWLRAFGGVKDGVVSLVKDAVQARFPGSAPSDALGPLGDSRGLIRGVTEPEANFRARLLAAFQLWQWAGTPYGLLAALYSAGYPNPVVQTQAGQQYSLNGYTGDPSADLIVSTVPGLHLGGSPSELWSDIAVLILQPWPAAWGSTAPADGSTDQQTVARLVAQWKAAHNRCVQLKAIKGPAWGVSMTWGSFTWGAGTTTVWTPPIG